MGCLGGGWLAASLAATLPRFPEDDQLVIREWGILAPVIFISLQALQVIIAPIPGELTGILGGYLFDQWVGLLYSTIGLTVGSVAAFAVGRWLGAHYVQRLVSPDIWRKLGFIIEAEGIILCFVIFLIPGLPKDMTCYLFGSPGIKKRSEEHTSELQSLAYLVCRLLLEKKKKKNNNHLSVYYL